MKKKTYLGVKVTKFIIIKKLIKENILDGNRKTYGWAITVIEYLGNLGLQKEQ